MPPKRASSSTESLHTSKRLASDITDEQEPQIIPKTANKTSWLAFTDLASISCYLASHSSSSPTLLSSRFLQQFPEKNVEIFDAGIDVNRLKWKRM
ncbi:unnamed protein product [Rhizophagus irregularis]|uniref:Uncharacterized protein n=1 Tax=Rhizophagus irregularis TaxID=588596 RepID=A0A916E1D4_9GLOM|nr:unnamed protein product [Rhizophagus irregularis]CAB5352487.1 unnamed protein product [Rhizophagus irregularis]